MGGLDGREWLHGHASFEQHLVAHTATNLQHRLGPRFAVVLIHGLRTGSGIRWVAFVDLRAVCAWGGGIFNRSSMPMCPTHMVHKRYRHAQRHMLTHAVQRSRRATSPLCGVPCAHNESVIFSPQTYAPWGSGGL
eukprot:4932377-Prymnesium_polylepis.1